MILRRFYLDALAQASYMIGCAETGEGLVIDANRDVEPYLEAASREKLRITHVTETHIHADYLSGTRELAARTGATIYLSDEGGDDWRYGFIDADGVVKLHDGDSFEVGNIRIDVLHTPGHTPEHLSFVVTDTKGADRPMGIVTGDFVFVGDVGRPDLLEKAAGVRDTMAAAARQLFQSLERFRALDDYLQVWPGHGAGSACGKALGAVPQSTVGYEKLFNAALQHKNADAFVQDILAGQPAPPKYFAQMKRLNRDGPPVLGSLKRPARLAPERLPQLTESAATIIDTRRATDFAQGHAPGTINIPYNRAFITWAGWLVPYDRDIYLIVADAAGPETLDEVVKSLALIGVDRIAGYFGTDAIASFENEQGSLQRIVVAKARDLAAQIDAGTLHVLDVRNPDEWASGHVPGATHIPLGSLADRIREVPTGQPIAVHCEAGGRSAIAASLLQAHGITEVTNIADGYTGWVRAGLPVVT